MEYMNKKLLAFFFASVIANVQVEASNIPGPMLGEGSSGPSISQSYRSGLDTPVYYSLDYPEDFNRAMRDHVVFLFQQE